jgi:8-oxo-dGTP pyrophosphatase MutT (NUDIX family)
MPSKYRYNRYRDLEIDLGCLRPAATDPHDFAKVVKEEYDRWARRLDRSRDRFTAVMWLSLPKSHAKFLQCLVGDPMHFSLHHANNARVMLVKTHPDSRGETEVPSYGTHYVKVECVVVEDVTLRVLMVMDRICATRAERAADNAPNWQKDSALKLVSGSSETGEFFADAAVREVYEETGIRARFGSLIGCGNRLRTRFDRDEVIMGCLLHAEKGQKPHADGSEVSEAMWCEAAEAAERCTPMSREWIAAAHACKPDYAERSHTDDLFRGKPHAMDFFVPRMRTAPY